MLKKSITYEDFNGEEQTEDFYFHLTKAELVEYEMDHYSEGGLEEALKRIVAANDGKTIMAEMKKIILKSYGVKSPDGKRFIKNDQLREQFESSEAYSVMFMEMVTEADAAAAFVNGVMPKGMPNDNQEELSVDRPNLAAVNENPIEPKTLTRDEIVAMDNDELRSGLATGRYILAPE